ncbi:hypothetical protein ACFL0A_00695 [Patescibacteria group bacterium]
MKIFELHFNSKDKEDTIFDSFCYEPENVYEKKLGALFLVGELKNTMPKNLGFLDNLAKAIKEKYYNLSLKPPEKAFSETLKATNEFLAALARSGNVSWLGNLNFAILSLKNYNLNFTKVGNLKILLLRDGQINDIGKNLDFQQAPEPLKIFSNIVSGKMTKNDKIMVLTKEVFEFFSNRNLIKEISKKDFDEKKLKEISKKNEKEFKDLSGVFLLVQLRPEVQPKYVLTFKKEPDSLLSWIVVPIQNLWPKIKERIKLPSFQTIKRVLPTLKNLLKRIKFPKISFAIPKILPKTLPKITFPKFSFPFKFSKEKLILKQPSFKKKISLVLFLILILVIGFFVFKGEREEKINKAREVLEKVEEKDLDAQNLLILKEEGKANSLYQEAWNLLLPQIKTGAPLQKQALSLKSSIESNLYSLNKLEFDPVLNLVFEFKPKDINFIPQKMIILNENLYFFNPFSLNIYKLNIKEKTGKILQTSQAIKMGTVLNDSALFFLDDKEDSPLLTYFENETLLSKSLTPPSDGFNFDDLASFKSNIYFLDTESGAVIKYSQPTSQDSSLPQDWLSPQTKKPVQAKAMALDGSVWILNKSSEISRYYSGSFQETLSINLFPFLEKPTKIWTLSSLPYLYVLEPLNERIIILNKQGQIFKQFQSQKLDNLLDFAVSENGKTIYLLNDFEVYQLSIE